MPSEPIDVAYTWVDMLAPEYLDLVQRHSTRPRDLNPERYRDPYELLRYSLRSVERHAPWVRNVYLFTCRPHVPSWLRRDHPRVRVVHHDEVGAPEGTLPTFNSNVIESLLHLLPGISRRLLYFNDDYFLGADVTPADFFAPDGRMKVFGTVCGERFRTRCREHQVISLGLLEHAPILIDRDEWAAMQAAEPAAFEELRRHRFRQPDDLRPDRLYRWHLLSHRRGRVVVEPFWRYLRYSRFHKIKNDLAAQQRACDRLRRDRPKFICFNDDQRDHPNPEVVTLVRGLLAELYPRPSSFEQS